MRPGARAVAGSAVTIGVLDIWCLVRHDDSISQWCRDHPVLTVLVLVAFGAHLTGWPRWAQRYDPFRAILAAATVITGALPGTVRISGGSGLSQE